MLTLRLYNPCSQYTFQYGGHTSMHDRYTGTAGSSGSSRILGCTRHTAVRTRCCRSYIDQFPKYNVLWICRVDELHLDLPLFCQLKARLLVFHLIPVVEYIADNQPFDCTIFKYIFI